MTAEGKTRKGVGFLAKVVEKDTNLVRSYVVADPLVVRFGERGYLEGGPRVGYSRWMHHRREMRTLGSGRSKGWSRGTSNLYSKPAARKRAHGRIGRAHIPRLVCRQGPPDFESGLAT